jgi:FKBP-type peptidyl-prolyl cis-trans isomerase SlyD
MKIQIVSFHCVLKNTLGKIISSTYNRDILTGSGFSEEPYLKGLANGLQDLKEGERRLISVPAAEAYGFYDPNLTITVSRTVLPTAKKQGTVFLMFNGKRKSFLVTQINPNSVVLDGNHPLAGQDLVFEIQTTAVRDATPEEISDSQPEVSDPLLH